MVLGAGGLLFPILVCFVFYTAYLPLFLPLNPAFASLIQTSAAAFIFIFCAISSPSRIYTAYLFLFLFLALLFASTWFTGFNIYASHNYNKVVILFMVFSFSAVAGAYLSFSNRIDLFVKVFVYTSAVTALLVYVSQHAVGYSRLGQDAGANPIWIARIAEVFVLYCVISYCCGKGRVYELGLALLCFMVMLQTGSRGPLLSLILSIFIAIFLLPGNHYRKLAALILSISLFIFVASFLPDFILQRLMSADSTGRDYLAISAVEMFKDNPWGWGAGSFGEYVQLPESLSYPHNIVLESLAELGLIFSILYIFLILLGVTASVKVMRKKGATINHVFLGALLFCSLINSMFSGDMISPKELYLLCFFFIVTLWNKPLGNG